MVAFGSTVTNFLSFRTNEALVRFYTRGKVKNNQELQYFSIVAGLILDVVTGVIMLITIQFSAEAIATHLLKSKEDIDAVYMFSYIASAYFLRGTGSGLLTAKEYFVAANVLSVLEQALKVSLVLWGVGRAEDLNLQMLMVLIFASSIPITLLYLIIAYKHLFQIPPGRWVHTKWIRFYWYFSVSTFVSSTLKSGHKNIDSVILGYFSSPSIVGIYNLFKQFISPIEMLAAPYALQIYPKFVHALSAKKIDPIAESIRQGSNSLLRNGCLVMLVTIPSAYIYFSWVDIRLIGKDYVSFFILLAASFIIQRLWWSRAFSLASKPGLSITANITALVITLFTMPILITLLGGLLGAAVTILLNSTILFFYWTKAFKVAYDNLF